MSLDYRVISIGALASHPIWNEKGDRRPGHATTTLVRSGDAVILVDPSLPPNVLTSRLDERAGIKPGDITHVFLTCFHPLHRRGLSAFPDATWLVAEREREAIGVQLVEQFRQAAEDDDEELKKALGAEIETLHRCTPAPDRLADGVDLFPLPGVTPGLAGLLLADAAATILICGDAIPSVEHLLEGRVLAPCHDVELARASFAEAIEIADLLVLGRDNLVLNPVRRI